MTIAEELEAQGSKQGLLEGRELGLEQGLIRGRRQTLERLMTAKFGPLSEAVNARIQAADLELLDTWLERIFDVETPDAVVEASRAGRTRVQSYGQRDVTGTPSVSTRLAIP